MTPPLDVLLVESAPGIGEDRAEALRRSGHRVHRCHEVGETHAFPCRGIVEPGACPLLAPVDVALVVRRGVVPNPSGFEHAATCAIRAEVPVVEDGTDVLDPFEPWLAGRVRDDAVVACERAAAGRWAEMGEAIRLRLDGVLRSLGHDVDDVTCLVRAAGGRLVVDVVAAFELDERLRQTLSVRALDAVRQLGWGRARSVGVRVAGADAPPDARRTPPPRSAGSSPSSPAGSTRSS